MIRELSEYILLNFADIDYVDRRAGVVQVVTKDDKTLPAGYIIEGEKCGLNKKFQAIIPESAYKGVMFFEDKGIASTKTLSRVFGFRADLRLICWINNNKIGFTETTHTVSTIAIADFTKRLSQRLPVNSIFINTKVAVTNIAIQDAAVFGKYDFDDKTSGYLQGNFSYFAMDLAVNFYIPKNCAVSMATNLQNC